MSEPRKSFHREDPDTRRDDLIAATLHLIARSGIRSATVRAIAAEAGVTQGLIRHYFTTKEELIAAAFERHMTQLSARSMEAAAAPAPSALQALARVIEMALQPPSSDADTVAIWAGFLQMIQLEPQMLAVHQRAYLGYRDTLEALIARAYSEAGIETNPTHLRRMAIACNAVLDGLWIEGGLLPHCFDPGETVEIALRSVADILHLPGLCNACKDN